MKKWHVSDNGFDGLKKDLYTDPLRERHARLSSGVKSDSDSMGEREPDLESCTNQDVDTDVQHSGFDIIFSRLNGIFAGILILCLVGFSVSNWMMHKQVARLAATTTDVQSRLAGIDADKRKKKMGNRIAILEDGFRKIRIRLRRQSDGEGMAEFDLRLVEAEKKIARLRADMDSTMEQERIGRTEGVSAGPELRTARAAKEMPQSASVDRESMQVPARYAQQLRKGSEHAWVVNLVAIHSESAADSELKKMRGFGIVAKKHKVEKQKNTYWRLRVTGFHNLEAARGFIRSVAAKHGYADAWIARTR